jgi:potassium-transporting ATPase KdpC subunit
MLIREAMYHLGVLTVVTGLVYPLAVTGVAAVLFPDQARGERRLLGQEEARPEYFWPRPSETKPGPYNAGASAGSNEGPLHPERRKRVAERRAKYGAGAPADLLTASGSGLDPHISPAAAEFQAARVAGARRMEVEEVRRAIETATEPRQFGVLGEPRVNVGDLNRTLDALLARRK